MRVRSAAAVGGAVGILAGLAIATPPPLPRIPPPFEEPFSPDSCWKTPISQEAEYVDIAHELAKLKGFGISSTKWTAGVYQATDDDPEVQVFVRGPALWRLLQSRQAANTGNDAAREALLVRASSQAPQYEQNYYSTTATPVAILQLRHGRAPVVASR